MSSRLSPIFLLREFFRLEAAGGILLVLAAAAAMVLENSALSNVNDRLLEIPVGLQLGAFVLNKSLAHWINDGLMAVFFLIVGLEIKREVLQGHLSSLDRVMLPGIAAAGGVIVPALIYWYLNQHNPEALAGWAIPTATDIAFALGVVQLLGNRVPAGLKVTLVTIAIIDDLIAIAIIAFFYTAELQLDLLLAAIGLMGVLAVMNACKVTRLAPYLLIGLVMWVLVLKSGVHATLAGVAVAMFIPLRAENHRGESPAVWLQHALHPWVAYLILPLFAFANAAVPLKGLSLAMLGEPVTLGIILGLFFGKQIGIMLITALSVALKICRLPAETNWKQYYGMSVTCGIGFTMSLFVGTLAFDGAGEMNAVRLGVMTGSLVSTLAGLALLAMTCPKK